MDKKLAQALLAKYFEWTLAETEITTKDVKLAEGLRHAMSDGYFGAFHGADVDNAIETLVTRIEKAIEILSGAKDVKDTDIT